MPVPDISIIIPVFNEGPRIRKALLALMERMDHGVGSEIILVDGGGSDLATDSLEDMPIRLLYAPKGRAVQMNRGATVARGKLLYFLHLDTLPPIGFESLLQAALSKGHLAGCFQMRFDSPSVFLRFFGWCTRLNWRICRGGDQSLFIKKDLFVKMGGFNESYKIYEDNAFMGRLYDSGTFTILPQKVITSARRYHRLGMVRLQWHYAIIHLKHFLGATPDTLYRYYQKHCTPKDYSSS